MLKRLCENIQVIFHYILLKLSAVPPVHFQRTYWKEKDKHFSKVMSTVFHFVPIMICFQFLPLCSKSCENF